MIGCFTQNIMYSSECRKFYSDKSHSFCVICCLLDVATFKLNCIIFFLGRCLSVISESIPSIDAGVDPGSALGAHAPSGI